MPISSERPTAYHDHLRVALSLCPCPAWSCRPLHPFFAGENEPSAKNSSNFNRPFTPSIPRILCQAANRAPCSCHQCKRRQTISWRFGSHHSCVGRNPAKNAWRLDSRFRGNNDFGVSKQVYYAVIDEFRGDNLRSSHAPSVLPISDTPPLYDSPQ